MKIGIFDSGIGGLSLLHQAMITLPEVDYVLTMFHMVKRLMSRYVNM